MPRIPFAKDLREKYPYAVAGHKKKCTCFICGLKRDEMWAKDNPYEAERFVQQKQQEREFKQHLVDSIRDNPTVAKANRDYAIEGNKYYKIQTENGMETLHCAVCTQRLGGLSFGCPIDRTHKGYVYGLMLNNPQDPRWMEQQYQKTKFNEPDFAQQQLKERMKDGGNSEALK